MEHISHYRHVVSSDVREVFTDALKDSIKYLNSQCIDYVGLIGSHKEELSHDIDVLIFPSKDAKLGQTIMEINSMYSLTEDIIKERNERLYLSLCPQKAMQEMTYYLSSIEEGAVGMIPIHSLFFPDYVSYGRLNPVDFQKEISKDILTLYGSPDAIKQTTALEQKKLEPYFLILNFEMNSRIKTFPRQLIRSSHESMLEYLAKNYNIPSNLTKKTHDLKDMDKTVHELLEYLDEVTYVH